MNCRSCQRLMQAPEIAAYRNRCENCWSNDVGQERGPAVDSHYLWEEDDASFDNAVKVYESKCDPVD